MEDVTRSVGHGARWEDCRPHGRDLAADEKHKTSACVSDVFRTAFLGKGWRPLIHGDQAAWLAELAKCIPLPKRLATGAVDLIHANRFFVLSFVEKIRQRRHISVVLYAHDIEAQQCELRNRPGFFILTDAGDDEMLAVERDRMSGIRDRHDRRRKTAMRSRNEQYPCALAERFFPEATRLALQRAPAS